MATKSYWLSYDSREGRRRRRRKWPWALLLLALLLLGALLTALALSSSDGETYPVEFVEPATIQEALPALLTDHVTVLYVVDDSDSMWNKLLPLHQALNEVATKHTENSEVALMRFGTSNELLFDFTEPSTADWETAIPSFTGTSGRTALYETLLTALDAMPAEPTCLERSRWLFFKETLCRERRIVLMSDGMAGDPHLVEDAMDDLVSAGIPVDTIAFGDDADRRGLQAISDITGGRFVTAY